METGLSLTLSDTTKTGFLATRPICVPFQPCHEKSVYKVYDQVRLASTCTVTVTSFNLEYLDIASILFIPVKAVNSNDIDQTANAQVYLYLCCFGMTLTGFLMKWVNS